MHNLSTMKQIKTWFAPLNLKSALHVVLQIYVFWGDVNLSGHLRLCILMVFRPSRVRRILMQFYVWKNTNGLFSFALSTPEDRLHDIIVFLYIWSSKFRLLIYRWKQNFKSKQKSREQVFLLPNWCIRYYLISLYECSLFLKRNFWHKSNKCKFGVIVHESRSIALLLYILCMKPILRSAQNLLVNDEDPLSC